MHDELFKYADALKDRASEYETQDVRVPVERLKEATDKVAQSFCGSWLGYHSRVYYEGLGAVPAGANISQDWGLRGDDFLSLGSTGAWTEYTDEYIKRRIYEKAGLPDLTIASSAADQCELCIEDSKAFLFSFIQLRGSAQADNYINALLDEAKQCKRISQREIINHIRPRGQFVTSDSLALGQGIQVPPHIPIFAEVHSIISAFEGSRKLGLVFRKIASHIERSVKMKRKNDRIGTNVFIGHGQSLVWRELKDFVQDRLSLPWDEFNRVPVAGQTNIARLSEMLDAAAIAFLVLTAEDEVANGATQARMNVIHEAGLFQGRLGFTKAIILLEDGCAEFSNINGLGQIRFPKGKISAVFEDVRKVFERENVT